MEGVKLLGMWGSPFSRRIDLALKLKGVEYESVDEDLSNKSEVLLRSNPIYKEIPVLVHGDRSIAGSLIIVEYIDETWKGSHSILPDDTYSRAHARYIAKFVDDKCWPAIIAAFRDGSDEKTAQVEEYIGVLEKEVGGKRFFGGETIGLADIACNFIAFWLEIVEEMKGKKLLTEYKFPALCQWRKEFLGDDAVKSSLPSRDRLVEAFRLKYRSHFKGSPPC